MGIFWTGIFPGNFPEGSLMVGDFLDRNFPGGFMQEEFDGWEFSRWKFFGWEFS